MSRIDDLIQDLCPEGVPFFKLQDVAKIRNGKDYKSFPAGPIPVFGTGGVMTSIDRAAYEGPSVLIPRKGSLNQLYFVEEPFWTVDTIFYTEIYETQVRPKFFYYYLKTQRLEELNQAGGIPSLTQKVLNRLPVPVPPLEVQDEIVRILDKFSALTSELEAELEARRTQYDHYRDALLKDGHSACALVGDSSVVRVPLSEVVEVNRGGGTPSRSREDYWGGDIPWASVGDLSVEGIRIKDTRQRISQLGLENSSTNLIAEGDVVIAVKISPGKAMIAGREMAINQDLRGLTLKDSVRGKFLVYYLQTVKVGGSGTIVKGISNKLLMKTVLPLPPREIQDKIVGTLDRFSALIAEVGAEIVARRKQYEYYRDRLLSFEEVPG